MTTTQARLAKKIKRNIGVDLVRFIVCRAGFRECGVYRWLAFDADGKRYHSQDTMTECLAARRISIRRTVFWFDHGAAIDAD